MDDEFFAAALGADHTNKVLNVLPLVQVVDSETALDRHRDADLTLHLGDDSCDQLCVFHQDCTKGAFLDFVGGAAAVDIDFVVAKLLCHLCGLAHSDWIIAANLADHGVLIWRK